MYKPGISKTFISDVLVHEKCRAKVKVFYTLKFEHDIISDKNFVNFDKST